MSAEPLRIVPDPKPQLTPLQLAFMDFLDAVRRASCMAEVNIAAGIAFEFVQELTS